MTAGLRLENVSVRFRTPTGALTAVNGIDLSVQPGEVLGVVGESGCGKSVTARAIMRLLDTNTQLDGHIWWNGRDLLSLTEQEMEALRGNELAMVFQDPMTTLNPVMSVGDQVVEGVAYRQRLQRRTARTESIHWLEAVGIPGARKRARQFPHQFSGGMRQRAVLATALCARPQLLIADEPTTALDVTVQTQILDRMAVYRQDSGAAMMLITHDLGVVAGWCDRVAVMYAGTIVEEGKVADVLAHPQHPYTEGLLASLPRPGQRKRLQPIRGRPPDLHQIPAGCPFAPRCPKAMDQCNRKPDLRATVHAGQRAACWFADQLRTGGTTS